MPEKILVVDDEADVEILFNQRFRKEIKEGTLELIFAKNGVEALTMLEIHQDIAIVLTDINMPEMDGLTLLGEILKLNRPIKTIVISAYGDMPNIRSAMNKGASDFITKPIDFQDLEVTLKKLIQQHRIHTDALTAKTRLHTIEKELEVARRIQQGMLPTTTKLFNEPSPPIELAGAMHPAKEVGGDFYDFFFLDKHRLAVIIADVSGKSIPACVFMAMAKTVIRTIASKSTSTADTFFKANEVLAADNESNLFVTVFYGVLNLATGELAYCNAGHTSPFLLTQTGVQQLPRKEGLALGIIENVFQYEETIVKLSPGDTLLLYTDGITEAMNGSKELYGEEALQKGLESLVNKSPVDVLEAIVNNVKVHSGIYEQSDDITLLALRFNHTLVELENESSTTLSNVK
jgi:sigma-B regulation protein RsbU (phosphoserine phosphatase)